MMKHQGLFVIAGGMPGDCELTFGSDGLLLVGVVFFPSSSLVGVILFPCYVRRRNCARECIWKGRVLEKNF